jgi:hypothetical protein
VLCNDWIVFSAATLPSAADEPTTPAAETPAETAAPAPTEEEA